MQFTCSHQEKTLSISVTAKVTCANKIEQGEGEDKQVQVSFTPDYNDGRNKEWSLYTPSLSLSMTLKGSVADRFTPGHHYTLTFTESDD